VQHTVAWHDPTRVAWTWDNWNLFYPQCNLQLKDQVTDSMQLILTWHKPTANGTGGEIRPFCFNVTWTTSEVRVQQTYLDSLNLFATSYLRLRFSSTFFSAGFSIKILYEFFTPIVLHDVPIYCCLNRISNSWRKVQIVKFHTMKFTFRAMCCTTELRFCERWGKF